MAFVTKKHLSRRTFLNGAGVTLALPFLESMIPAVAALGQTAAARTRTRLGCVYFPHGAIMNKWTPATEGAGFELSEILQPLKPFYGQINVISGLESAQAYGSGATANHNRSAASFLSAAHAETGATAPSRRHDRSGCRQEDRTGYAAAFDRADDRGIERELRRRSELLVQGHDFVAGADLSAADAEQPAGGIRAAVRRREHRRRNARCGVSSR